MIKITGIVTDINRNIVMDAVDESIHDWLLRVTAEIEDTAKELSPYQYGTNMRSITREVKKKSARVYSTSGYGGYLETGTKRMAARPYIWPAYLLAVKDIKIELRTLTGAEGG